MNQPFPRDTIEYQPLTAFNTLGLAVTARYYWQLTNPQQLPAVLETAAQLNVPVLILGGGSNLVLSCDFPGLVIHLIHRGVRYQAENDQLLVEASAGENWHELVTACVKRGLCGIENLALIPGTVGAAPIQNIGAYGVELSSVLRSVRGWDRWLKQWRVLSAEECELGYRDSIFKRDLKDRFVITSVTLALQSSGRPHTSYQALKDYLQAHDIHAPTSREVFDAVIAIRRSKLPDPERLPNVGSFFKNPMIGADQFKDLQARWPDIVYYPQSDGRVKLAAGWLLDQAGWKGRSQGNVAMHKHQALVMVNLGGASADEVLQFARSIQEDIQTRFGVVLEVEPTIV